VSTKTGELQCRFVYSCYQDDDAKTALNILIRNHLPWLPVINQQQQFMGIIGLSDIISIPPKQTNVIKFNPSYATKQKQLPSSSTNYSKSK
jgi:CBS-domain-containing membrane protein